MYYIKRRIELDLQMNHVYYVEVHKYFEFPKIMDHPTRILETNHNSLTFEAFFERWLINQEHYLQVLLRLIQTNHDDENELLQSQQLINQVMVHYKEYYEAKARVVSENVFLVFAPPWFSSFERSLLWIGGFRVGLAFRLITNNVIGLTEDQSQRISTLMIEVKEDEKELTDELSRIQDELTSELVVGLARHRGRPLNGEVDNTESAFERLRVSMEALVESADSLRMKTVIKLMEILKPTQGVRFLAAAAHLQLRLRRFGMQRDAQFQRSNASLSNVGSRN